VQGGFCGLSCSDLMSTLATVGTDIFAGPALQQVVGTAAGCAQNLLTTLSGCAGEGLILGASIALDAPIAGIITDVVIEWVDSF
jgi:hypothetical protein